MPLLNDDPLPTRISQLQKPASVAVDEELLEVSDLRRAISELQRENNSLRARRPGGTTGLVALIGVIAYVWFKVSTVEDTSRTEHPDGAAPNPLSTEGDRGRQAATPEAIPTRGLRDVFWRVIGAIQHDRVTLIAAGVTYYLLLAVFPALGALVSLYGLIADPTQIGAHLSSIIGFLPEGSFTFLQDQLKSLTQQKTSSLGIGFFGGLTVALWSARNGIMAIFDAMNVPYEETEKRGLLRLNLIAIGSTFGAIVFAVLRLGSVTIVPIVLSFLWLTPWTETLALVLRWPILLLAVFVGVMLIYRFGPSREPAKLRWINWGAAFTTIAWTLTSFALSYYLQHFTNYSVT